MRFVNSMIEKTEQLQQQLDQTWRALQASETRFRNVIEKNADGIIIVDREGIVRFVNRAAEALLCRFADDLVGELFGFPLVVNDTTELDVICPRGKEIVAEMRVVESEWEGEFVYLASLRDITAHIKAKTELAWESEVNAALAELASSLLSSNALDDISLLVLDHARRLTGSEFGYVGYIDPRSGHLVCPTMTRDIWDRCQVPDKSIVFEEFGGLWGWVLQHRQSLLTNDLAQEPRSTGAPVGHLPIRRFLSAPAQMGEELVGQIALANPTRDYTAQDLALVERLATLYALAIQRTRAEAAVKRVLLQTEQREAEVTALLAGARAVLGYQEFEPAARAIFDACKILTGATCGYVALLNAEGAENEVLFLDSGGLSCLVDPELPMPIRGLRAEAYRSGQAVYDNDFAGSQWDELMPGGHVTLENVMFAPLVLAGRVVGLIGLANKPAGFTELDAALAETFGELAAISLRNSRTLEALQESEERYRILFNSGDDAVFVHSIENGQPTKFTEVNDIACRRLGYTKEELLALTPLDIDAVNDPADMSKLMAELLANKQFLFERQYVRKDGQPIPVEVNALLFDLNNQPTVLAVARDITERKLSELQIKAALREKEILLQEIHHRVKNNLSIVSSLLSVQADLIEDEQARAAFQESQNRIHSIARIHEHLYRSVDLARVDMADYIQNLIDFLQMSYGSYGVAIAVDVADDLTLDIQAAIPCGLIVNELVSNIFKYAFPLQPDKQNGAGRKGDQKIWVELFESVEAELVMVVRDNGQGLPPDFDWRHAPSLGLQLVNLLVRQSQGRIEVDLTAGTSFKIILPPAYRKEKTPQKTRRVTA